jgi:hypothetical protein
VYDAAGQPRHRKSAILETQKSRKLRANSSSLNQSYVTLTETFTPRSLTEMFPAIRLKLEHCIKCKLPRVGDFNCIKILLKISHSSCNRRTESDNPRVPCSETCSS